MSSKKDDAELMWNVTGVGCVTLIFVVVFGLSISSSISKDQYYATCANNTSLFVYRKGQYNPPKYRDATTNEKVFLTNCKLHEAENRNTEYVTVCGKEKVYHVGIYNEIFVLDDGSYRTIDTTCSFTVERNKE